MYFSLPSLILGFHGCDRSIAEKVFQGKTCLEPSTNSYDWLGSGVYFWENNPQRALEFAEQLRDFPVKGKNKVLDPAVVGAVLDLGNCLNLLDSKSLELICEANKFYELLCEVGDRPLAENKPISGQKEIVLRYRDCAVIETLHATRKQNDLEEISSVRGMFSEGRPIYPGAGFQEKDHIQICIRNPNCIKGYFRVLEPDSKWPIP